MPDRDIDRAFRDLGKQSGYPVQDAESVAAHERLRNNPKRRALAERAQGYMSPGAAYVLRDAAATVGATAEQEHRDLSRSERKAIKLLLDLAARYDGSLEGRTDA